MCCRRVTTNCALYRWKMEVLSCQRIMIRPDDNIVAIPPGLRGLSLTELDLSGNCELVPSPEENALPHLSQLTVANFEVQ